MTKVDVATGLLMQYTIVVASRVRIEGIRLAQSFVRSKLKKVNSSMQVQYSFDAETSVDREAQRITVLGKFSLAARCADDPAAGEPPLVINAEFELDYTVIPCEGLTDQHFEAFGKINGIHNAWPYWREYVQSTTVRLGLSPLTLPVLTGDAIVALYQQQEKQAHDALAQEKPEANALGIEDGQAGVSEATADTPSQPGPEKEGLKDND
jgi:hypothetical protein